MDMVATCPDCGTRFRITAEQLNARQGDVRCGRCTRIFNAFDGLVTLAGPPSSAQLERDAAQESDAVPVTEPFLFTLENDEGPEEATALRPEEAPKAPPPAPSPIVEQGMPLADAAAARRESSSAARPPAGQAAATAAITLEPRGELPVPPPTPEHEPHLTIDFSAVTPADEMHAVPLMEPLPSMAEAVSSADYGAIRLEPREEERAALAVKSAPATQRDPRAGTAHEKRKAKRARTAARRWPAWLFGIGSVLMALGLAAQATYFYRTDLAARYPELKPYLSRACASLQCDIPLPRDADLLGIEASELETANPAHPSMILLRATLRNRAEFVQGYPSLQLSLTNSMDQVIARRIFTPREYLASGIHLAAGMPPAGEAAIKLYMDVGNLKAIGYRLYLFYP